MPAPTIRHIGTADVKWALSEGWKDFQDKRGDLIFAGLLYPLIGLIAATLAFNDRLLPLFFPVVAGLSILGPAVASGFYELARRREEHIDASWFHFLDPLRGRSRGGIIGLTLMLLVLFIAWLGVAWAIYDATIGSAHPMGASDFLHVLFTTRQGWTMILLGNAAGAVFAVVTLILTIVSFPLVVDKPVDSATAVRTSIAAAQANPSALISWGARVALLLFLGSLPLFIGLAVVLPVLGYATWHLYTRIVER